MPTHSLEHLTYPYTVAEIEATYSWNSGRSQLPITGRVDPSTLRVGAPGVTATTATVQAHQPVGRKTVTFRFERLGAQPVPPDPAPANDKEVLLDATVSFSEPSLAQDEKHLVYRMS